MFACVCGGLELLAFPVVAIAGWIGLRKNNNKECNKEKD
tara:strand:- start:87 stop:203 length:117 start_codon:yes stop_codon:yes gene_type:complete